MAEVIERVGALEEALMKLVYAQFNTEVQIQELSKEMRAFRVEMSDFKVEMSDFKNEMSDFKNEMSDFKNEMSDFKNEMSDFKNEMSDFKRKVDDDIEEMKRDRREMNKRWGEAVNRWGSIAEDLVYPNVARIAHDLFGATDFDLMGLRVKRRHATEAGRMREFDTVATWDGRFLLVEVKATLRPEYFRDFVAFVREGGLWSYFPEYRDRQLIPVFASFALPESDLAYLTKEGIYGMALGDSTMEILNAGAVAAQSCNNAERGAAI